MPLVSWQTLHDKHTCHSRFFAGNADLHLFLTSPTTRTVLLPFLPAEEELPDPSPPASPPPPCVELPEKTKIISLAPEGTC